jgi:UDP-perosamine 4-acetyltransferase
MSQGIQVVVYGAGGHSKIVLETLSAEAEYEIVGLLGDDPSKHGTLGIGCPVLGGCEQLPQLKRQGISKVIVAIGDNARRVGVARRLQEDGFEFISTVHPTAVLLDGAHVGPGSAVTVYAFIGGDATVGDHAIINVGAVVGHDSRVGLGVQIAPRACLAGGVQVGDFSLIGMGASVLPGITVGRHVAVGANAVVREDLPDGVTVVGVPARIVKRREGEW